MAQNLEENSADGMYSDSLHITPRGTIVFLSLPGREGPAHSPALIIPQIYCVASLLAR